MLTEAQLLSFQPNLLRYVRARFGRQDADENLQQANVRIWSRRSQFEGNDQDAQAWMIRVAHNAVLSGFRASRRDPLRYALDIVPSFTAISNTEHAETGELGAGRQHQREFSVPPRAENIIYCKEVARAAARHKHGDMLLSLAGGLNRGHAAKCFNVPAGTVSARVFRTREKVRMEAS